MTTGKLVVSEEVFGDIARAALHTVEDVIRQERKGALGRLFTGRLASKVNVKKSDTEGGGIPGSVSFDLRLTVAYGVNIPEVASKVRDAVVKDVSNITGYEVERVDITVEKLVQAEDLEANEQ